MWDKSGDFAINIPASMASISEMAQIRIKIPVVEEISTPVIREGKREHPRTSHHGTCRGRGGVFSSLYTLARDPVAVDRDEVIIKELGCYSEGVEISQRQVFQDQQPDLHRKYDASTTGVSVETLLKSYHYCQRPGWR